MYYVYLLKDDEGKLYIGFTNDLRRRMNEHDMKKTYTTRRMNEPKLVYYEAYSDKGLAQTREKKLKQFGSSYSGLIKRIGFKK